MDNSPSLVVGSNSYSDGSYSADWGTPPNSTTVPEEGALFTPQAPQAGSQGQACVIVAPQWRPVPAMPSVESQRVGVTQVQPHPGGHSYHCGFHSIWGSAVWHMCVSLQVNVDTWTGFLREVGTRDSQNWESALGRLFLKLEWKGKEERKAKGTPWGAQSETWPGELGKCP